MVGGSARLVGWLVGADGGWMAFRTWWWGVFGIHDMGWVGWERVMMDGWIGGVEAGKMDDDFLLFLSVCLSGLLARSVWLID